MAHGFLTPTPVSGDNFWSNVQDLWKKLQELKKKKAPPEEVVPVVVNELQNALPPGRQKLLSSGKQQSVDKPKALNMLNGSSVAKMLGSGKSEITIKQQPQLPEGGLSSSKGGTFTNLPGISAAPKKLDTDAFFKAAQTGVHPETGQYLNSDERKEYLKKSKTTMNAPASVAAGGINSASSIGEVTRGDEEIVSSVEDLTKVVVSLVSAVKAQTAAQLKAANAQKASTERTANRALAAAEESSLEQSSDLSGSITPTYGTNSGALMPSGAGSGGGGASGGLMGGKAAQAITKRGLGRALPRLGASVAGKAGARAGAQATAKIGTNVAAKTGGKALARMIPGVQTALGVGFAMDSFSKGDVLGGLLNLGSAIPGPLGWAFLGGSVAKDLSGGSSTEVAPFAQGGIISSPTLSMMGEGNKKEGVFPLQGREGKKTFEMFGQGVFDAQKKNKREYANIQASGLRQYYENQGGIEAFAKGLVDVFKGLGGALATLFGGPANAKEQQKPEDYLNGDFSGSSGQSQAMNYFMSQGLTKEQSAGIVGNLMQESGAGIDPNAKNKTGHRGIAQWDKNRWGNFEKFAKQKGLDVNTREAQLQWIMEEMRTGGGGLSLKTLKGAKTSRQSAELFLKQYERSGEEAGSAGFENRMKNADKLAATKDFGSTLGAGTGGSKLENDILSFRKARTKFGVSGNRVASDSTFNLAVRELRGASGGSSINPLADDKSYQDVHKGEAHKKGYGFDIPVGNREQSAFVIDFFRSRGYETIHGRAEDPTGGHDHHVHVQAPKAKAKEFMMAMKPKPKTKPEQGTTKPTVEATRNYRGGEISPIFQPANANTGTGMMATSAQVQMGAMGLSAVGGGNITNIYNSNGQQVSPIGNTLSAGTPSGNAGLSWMALIRR